jgi:hypothetical protein
MNSANFLRSARDEKRIPTQVAEVWQISYGPCEMRRESLQLGGEERARRRRKRLLHSANLNVEGHSNGKRAVIIGLGSTAAAAAGEGWRGHRRRQARIQENLCEKMHSSGSGGAAAAAISV